MFGPGRGGGPEEGHHATFTDTAAETMTGDFVVLAPDDIAAGPVPTVPMPVRVPRGPYGNWFPPRT